MSSILSLGSIQKWEEKKFILTWYDLPVLLGFSLLLPWAPTVIHPSHICACLRFWYFWRSKIVLKFMLHKGWVPLPSYFRNLLQARFVYGFAAMATWTSIVDFDTNQPARSQHVPTKLITNLEKPLFCASCYQLCHNWGIFWIAPITNNQGGYIFYLYHARRLWDGFGWL